VCNKEVELKRYKIIKSGNCLKQAGGVKAKNVNNGSSVKEK
jgi:hypothetical protein